MRTTSDALTEVIGTSAMTMDTLLAEQTLQLTLAAMEAVSYTPLDVYKRQFRDRGADVFRFVAENHPSGRFASIANLK